ncbi:MAG: DinB family protein [candidate division NC10 bacterium]|nr:DinB family protein [candidate division NC10 bacterium]
MPFSLGDLKTLYAFNAWARKRMLDAAAQLDAAAYRKDLGNSFGSVHGTVVHILGAEEAWLMRWHGESPTALVSPDAFVSFAEVRRRWDALEADYRQFLARLTEEAVAQLIHYRDLRGDAYTTPLWQAMQHMVNHLTYHRGQVTTLLRQLGAKPVATDLIAFYRQQAGQERPM